MRPATALTVVAVLLGVATATRAHERHVTFAEVRHVPDEGVLQVVLDIDTADLEQELAARAEDAPLPESAGADSAIVDLLDARFVVRDAADTQLPLRWVGKEVGIAESSLYFAIEIPGTLDGLTLEQTLGLAFHARQVNTVNVHAEGTYWTLVFTRAERTRPLARAAGNGD